jgi:hypothetical protein
VVELEATPGTLFNTKGVVMKWILGLFLVLAAPGLSLAETVNFDSATPGQVPPGWTVAMTHTGGAPKWEVLKDDTAPTKPNVFAQVSNDSTSGRFPLAIWEKANFKDGALTVKFKPVSGQEDQAAGMVWRYRDPDNYYIVRANAAENNVVLYKVETGKRSPLAPKGTPPKTYGVKHNVPSGVWSTLRVTFEGNLFSVYFDGTKLFEVEDETFKGAGKVGLWTKADSVTYFDDFAVEDLSGAMSSASPGKILAQKLVDELAAKHPELVRIGLHLTPPTGSENLIVASNVASKIGQKSDPEDLAAMRTGKPVALREQGNFDVTLPLREASGKVIGAIGLTFKPAAHEPEAAAIQRAQSIARELEKQISSQAKLFDVAG